ncbi:RidA family protein [Noviherbaspirillum pedocola]|uniref:RidA family protein n=1 Tax=Noviherbaspirillum pedocola TaxID=2801341 RepID=A0A934T469_9BURK|nr:RidA family protein [Noviherbaspirillum pedocola]MBK4738803.1 RidA family protein [Noviherbaspirillum pedocola]
MPHQRLNPDTLYRAAGDVYSQIVRSEAGTQWHIAGMVPLDRNRQLVGEDDMAAQVRQVMHNVRLALDAVGAGPEHIVRIHIYTTDMDRFMTQGRELLYGFFGDAPPASTLLGVARLADARYLVEVEVTAVSG